MAKKREVKEYIKYKRAPKSAYADYEKVGGEARKVLDIAIGKHIPITDDEKAIAKDLREAKAKGYFIDLPFD